MHTQGIQISTPEERKVAQTAEAMRYADALPPEEFTYVLIPADPSKPLEQLTHTPTSNKPGDSLVDHLKSSFAKGTKKVDLSMLQEQATQTLAGTDAPKVSTESLTKVSEQASVEIFTVVHGGPSNKFTEVNIYLDEVGMLKRLSLNPRASAYAKAAGFDPPPQFYGDVYMGRVQRKPAMRNANFTLGSDTAMDAPWLQAATMENINHQMELNRLTGRVDELQPRVDGEGAPKKEDGYSWTQTEEELEVCVPLTDGVKSKEIKVIFHPHNLKVALPGIDPIHVNLFESVDVDGCTWTIESGKSRTLVISMEKMEGALWPRIKD